MHVWVYCSHWTWVLVEYQHWPLNQVLVIFLKFVQWCTIIRNAETNLIRKTGDMWKSICTAMGGFIDVPLVVRRHYLGVVGHKMWRTAHNPTVNFWATLNSIFLRQHWKCGFRSVMLSLYEVAHIIIIIIIIIFIFHLSIFGYIPRDVEIVKWSHIRET